MADLHIVLLAAGKGTRMRSALPKVLHQACGLPLIEHVLRAADSLNPTSTIVVVGHEAELVREQLGSRRSLTVVVQEPQLGTGHALRQAETPLAGRHGTVVVLSGDVPLLRPDTLARLVQTHIDHGAAATVLTAIVGNPAGYGRIVRHDGLISSIVEQRDATAELADIREINSGIYAFDLDLLFDALRSIGPENAQGEYYLPDLVRIYRARGLTVETVALADPTETLGVNSRRELAVVSAHLRDRKNDELMAAGVTIVDPLTTWIEPDVSIGPDTILHPGVHLQGRTTIGARCQLQPNVRVVSAAIGDDVLVNSFCLIVESRIGAGARIGPFAHIRPQSDVGELAHVGNFVELKKTTFGRGSKANHLAYLGDATIGEKVNIGAGTITCNYDGVAKNQTVIEDGAFIGSDSQLVAPVRIGKGAYVAAGSSITEDVPPGALGIARGTQINKEGWVARRKARRLPSDSRLPTDD
jgi:bifunctional UDP-N-acetylglucosamine pyrophosphorylase / glucosamine-1-phosphate N-acetyltransferase